MANKKFIMKFRSILSLFALLAVADIQAQQIFTFSQFMQHNFVLTRQQQVPMSKLLLVVPIGKCGRALMGGLKLLLFMGINILPKRILAWQ
jgi:hypothetical protein